MATRWGVRVGAWGLRLSRLAARMRNDVNLACLDLVFASAAYLSMLVMRFDGSVPPEYWDRLGTFAPVALLVTVSSGCVWGLYGQVWEQASVNEARRVLLAGASTTVVLLWFATLAPQRMPLSVIVLGGLSATMLSGGLRFQSRLFALHRADRGADLRVVVVGAGDAGGTIIRELLSHPKAGLIPVAVVDDDPQKQRRSLLGIPVAGTIDDLEGVIDRFGAMQAVLAIPSADADLVQRTAEQAERARVPLKVLPPIGELFGGEPTVRDVRDLSIKDLLGRNQVDTDLDRVAALLRDRTVLITGAGGSIGCEIARQVAQFDPRSLVLLEHDETHLYDVAAELGAVPLVQVLADIRDRKRVAEIFAEHRPDVVFHAAAHKHVPLLEAHPCEAVHTNVTGTHNVLAAADAVGVAKLVFISTDKAVSPSCVMGASKWCGEQLVRSYAGSERHWCAVRFGNVLGSRGSVIPTFARQIASGGPVTVTDARMTRYFMSTSEAIQLVLQAAVLASGGEVFELEMGRPVNILELAERMIRLSGRSVGHDIPITFTGVRPGEKLEEQLRGPDDVSHPTSHPAIVRLDAPLMRAEQLEDLVVELHQAAKRTDAAGVRAILFNAVEPQTVIDLTEASATEPWASSAS